MGYARIWSRGEQGLDAPGVTVEVQLAGGLPIFNIVGLAATAVRESRDRVRGALTSAGFDFPVSRIVVNLAPADLPKYGGRFDLAIALGILVASGQLRSPLIDDTECFAELTLAGQLAPFPGVLPAARAAASQGRAVLVAGADAPLAALAPGCRAHGADTLVDAVAHLAERAALPAAEPLVPAATGSRAPDLADVRGQAAAKRALTIAAAGGHNLLMVGPPGSGKSMLAERLPGLLPALSGDEALSVAAVQSLSQTSPALADFGRRPFRSPHHSASAAALVGGGSRPRPGEVSRAHCGVLFLDELPEFSRQALEMLREPLESGEVHIARAEQRVRFPARFQLVAAMNPCPCGFLGDPEVACRCSLDQVQRYTGKLSGPLLDRIDLSVTLGRVRFDVLTAPRAAPQSAAVAEQVVRARAMAVARQGCVNAALDGAALDHWLSVRSPDASAALDLLRRAAERLKLSARACHRVLRVARTIADLTNREDLGERDVAEALSMRLPGSGGVGSSYCPDSASM